MHLKSLFYECGKRSTKGNKFKKITFTRKCFNVTPINQIKVAKNKELTNYGVSINWHSILLKKVRFLV
jgi:hypothetical protein